MLAVFFLAFAGFGNLLIRIIPTGFITGDGTSIASISGMLVIARWRVVALVIATLFVTAVATGWLSALWL